MTMKLGKRMFGAASCKLSRTVQVPDSMRDDIVEVSALFCAPDQRKNGYARSLMQMVCDEADEAGKLLLLHAAPYDEGGMDAEQLFQWYSVQFGFMAIQAEPRLMARMVGATPRNRLNPVIEAVRT